MYSILTSKQIDLSTLQIFDIQGLLVKQDKQIRALSSYITDNCKKTFTINKSDTEIVFLGNKIADVSVVVNGLTIEMSKPLLSCIAYNDNDVYVTETNFKTIKIFLPENIDSCTVTMI
jgi:hypothetical protein